jgi:hypothetical protein
VIDELDARAALLGAPLGAHPACEHLAADDGQVVELALELVVEEIGLLRPGNTLAPAPLEEVEQAHR